MDNEDGGLEDGYWGGILDDIDERRKEAERIDEERHAKLREVEEEERNEPARRLQHDRRELHDQFRNEIGEEHLQQSSKRTPYMYLIATYEGESVHRVPPNVRTVYISEDAPGVTRIPHGRGRATFMNGHIYEGDFRYGVPHGSGILTYTTDTYAERGQERFVKEAYEGDFRDGWSHGWGSLTYLDGTKYYGYFRFGNRSGEGQVINSDGTVFNGEFITGHPLAGKGRLYYPNGVMIDGEIKDGKAHGRATVIHANKLRQKGVFENGLLQGFADVVFPDKRHVQGYHKNGRLHGRGQYMNTDGSDFIGDFHEGMIT
jgi:hypothetical protein